MSFSTDLTERLLSPKEIKVLPQVLQGWSARAYRGLNGVGEVDERLADCQKMCEEISSLLRSSGSSEDLRVIVCEDEEKRPQAILSAWKHDRSYTILKVVTCPWNISHTQEEKDAGFPRKGAGTKASLGLIARAKNEGCSVELSALASAKVFWERLGFQPHPSKPVTAAATPMILAFLN